MKSETIGKLALALSKAQGSIAGAKKDALNSHFKSKYADLASVWDACREALVTNELSVAQTTTMQGIEGVCVVTTLMHSSGEWMSGEIFMPVSKKDAHGFGSALTYARRYALAAIVGVSPEDDDAATAVAQVKEAKPEKSSVDADALYNAIVSSKNIEELAAAAASAAKKKAGLSEADHKRLSDAYAGMKDLFTKGAS